MQSDRRFRNIEKKEPSNVKMSSRYSNYSGDDKSESTDLIISAFQNNLQENFRLEYISDYRFKKKFLLISSIK